MTTEINHHRRPLPIANVISNDVCVGCGGCGALSRGRIPVTMNNYGYYSADISEAQSEDVEAANSVCPFSDDAPDEDAIADQIYPTLPHDPRIGRYLSLRAGRIADEQEILRSSSGGLTTYVLRKMLESDLVDGVIHVGRTAGMLRGYVVSHSPSELADSRKSQYYPAQFADVLNEVRGNGKRYVFVGVPCAVKAARLVTLRDQELRGQLMYFAGLVCGHMKSKSYAESFSWQLGIPPHEIEDIDFRVKNPGLLSRQYSFGARGRGMAEWRTRSTISLVGGSWGHALFQLNACNYCDDIFAETADIVFGDAWLPKYEAAWEGTNVVVARNPTLDSLIVDGIQSGDLVAEDLSVDAVAATQAGNYRHRREGLQIRLHDDSVNGRWVPRKRVAPSVTGVKDARVRLILQRRELSRLSHSLFTRAKQRESLDEFLEGIGPALEAYERLSKPAFRTRLVTRIKREFWLKWRALRGGRGSAS